MSEQTAQTRSCSDKPGGSSAPGGENGPFLEQSGASYACNKGRAGLVPPPTLGKSVKTSGAKRARRCTIVLHGPAAEADEVIWEMSV